MVDKLPGFVPQVLRRDDVSLLRADETVFNAMVARENSQKHIVAIGRSHGWPHNRSLASSPLARARVLAKPTVH
jgi:hypothetical protein